MHLDHDDAQDRTPTPEAGAADGRRGRHGRSTRGRKVRVLAGGVVAAAVVASVGTYALANPSGADDRRKEAAADAAPRAKTPPKRPAVSKSAKYAKQLLTLVNKERAKVGCRALRLDRRVQTAAMAHAKDMAARNYYDHTSPEGKSAGDRMRKAGYSAGAWGENIHKGPKGPKTAMRDWMRSSGHRKNILNCSYKDFGAGVSLKANGPWWVQNFATKR